jgi:eukaryotic-like serine/threonine-protein kinase
MPPLDASKPSLHQIGSYEILSKLAEGGMGAVYKGRSRVNGQIVAIKVLPPSTAKNPVLLKRFKQEFDAAHQLDHPNIVKAIEYCGNGPSPFLVMEFVEGESLGQKIERDGAMSEEESIRILAQVCQGLHRAHKNRMIHRDVKPDNVMVTPEGVAKLTDLGLVKDAENELNLTRTGRGLGTPHFMAPEQFRNAKNADIRCDIYSLGATLYMMVTGEVPFGKVGPLDCWMKKIRNDYVPPRDLNPNISDRIDWAIRRAMSGDPEQRPASCREFIEDVTGVTIRQPSVMTEAAPKNADIWYLVYKDDTGETHTVKGTTEGIRRAMKEQLLGDAANIRACRTKTGPFQELKGYPEFRDLVVEPAPMPPANPGTAVASPGTATASANPTPVNSAPSRTTPGKWKPAYPINPRAKADPEAVDLNQPPRTSAKDRPADAPAPEAKGVDLSSLRPHIKMQDQEGWASTLKMILVMIVIATATGFAAAFILPKLMNN